MSQKDQSDAQFYERLEVKLGHHTDWPSSYLFKFIVPNDTSKELAIREIFKPYWSAEIKETLSSSQKFISLSIRVYLENPKEVIALYQLVSKIDGVVML